MRAKINRVHLKRVCKSFLNTPQPLRITRASEVRSSGLHSLWNVWGAPPLRGLDPQLPTRGWPALLTACAHVSLGACRGFTNQPLTCFSILQWPQSPAPLPGFLGDASAQPHCTRSQGWTLQSEHCSHQCLLSPVRITQPCMRHVPHSPL